MEESEAKFFEELAGVTHKEKRVVPEDAIETPETVDAEIEPREEVGEEATLAKASLGTASRTKVPARKQEKITPKDEGGLARQSPAERDGGGPEGQLTIDVYQTPTEIVVESAVAGVKPDDIDISVSSDSVTIHGERRRERQVKDEDYLYQECYWGRFSRSVILPEEVDAERASVDFKNGILVVHLPKMNRQKTKKLKVRTE